MDADKTSDTSQALFESLSSHSAGPSKFDRRVIDHIYTQSARKSHTARMKRHAYVMPGQPAQAPQPTEPVNQLAPPGVAQSAPPSRRVEPVFPWAYPPLANSESAAQGLFPPYFRPVTSVFPASNEVATQCRIPFGVVVSPASVSDVPEIDARSGTCHRCSVCSAYLCTFSEVSPDGRLWTCALCGKKNAAPVSPSGGFWESKPEVTTPVYDVVAPDAYVHMDSGPAVLFVLDMSFKAWELGFTQQMIATMKSGLDAIPQNYKVGLMTMSSEVSVFDLKNMGEIVIGDLSDTGLSGRIGNVCVEIGEGKEALTKALDLVMSRVPTDPMQGNCIGSAYEIAGRVLARTGGVVLIGCCDLPRHGPHALRPRVAGEEGEVGLLRLPADGSGKFYRECAFMLNRACVSVHLFAAGTEFMDLSTIGVPPGLTCGSCTTYGNFDDGQKQRLHSDLFGRMTDLYCWDSTLRLRCSKGIKIVRPHTNCTLRKGDLVSFPVIARNDAIAFELAVETPITSGTVIFQLAMVFTDTNKRRMIRVFTFQSQVTGQANVILNSIDEAALTSLMMRRSVTSVLTKGPRLARLDMGNEVGAMLLTGAPFGAEFHLMHSMLGSEVFSAQHPGGVDGRMACIIRLRAMSLKDLLIYLYPRMFVTDSNCLLVPLNSQAFGLGSCIFVHTVDRIYIWIGSGVNPTYLTNAFGVSSLEQVPAEVPTLTTQENEALRNLLEQCWAFSGRYLPVQIMTQGNPHEAVFGDILKEEAHPNTNLQAFSDWLRQMRPTV